MSILGKPKKKIMRDYTLKWTISSLHSYRTMSYDRGESKCLQGGQYHVENQSAYTQSGQYYMIVESQSGQCHMIVESRVHLI